MKYETIISSLINNTSADLDSLFQKADEIRKNHVGDEIHLRGLIEISNICRRNCLYCGIRAENNNIQRYRLSENEILSAAAKAIDFRYGSVVLQSGEDNGIEANWIATLVKKIKELELAVTLSLGERDDEDYLLWREAGADRYLLRFETSNRALFNVIHPPLLNRKPVDRMEILLKLRDMGYEIGSGVMIGIPGQSYEDLARDIELFRTVSLDMIGCGPYLPHPQTPLGNPEAHEKYDLPVVDAKDQVPATAEMAFKVIALARIVCPNANIPCTTAVATIDAKEGRRLGLQRGANVVMPNLTPIKYRKMYEIYPNKAAMYLTAEQTH
ncbi:MAG: [FeFe] hydrogenase H-cluster radical SAM maturase HydE, partial [Planctomycetaceae bacterium]|nr:[FeFe] hydrogenase H-cluster radical SAM maturase HydE [Planctomycetaceae bacterium]